MAPILQNEDPIYDDSCFLGVWWGWYTQHLATFLFGEIKCVTREKWANVQIKGHDVRCGPSKINIVQTSKFLSVLLTAKTRIWRCINNISSSY